MIKLKSASILAAFSLTVAVAVGLRAQPAPEGQAGTVAAQTKTCTGDRGVCVKGKDCCRVTGKECTDSNCVKRTACGALVKTCTATVDPTTKACAKTTTCKNADTAKGCGARKGHGNGTPCARCSATHAEADAAAPTCKVAACSAQTCAGKTCEAAKATTEKPEAKTAE
jgi:hypothetical protein